MNCQMDLEQGWMTLVDLGPKTSCSVIHPHTSCLYQIFTKCKQVVGASSKLYALLYIAMLVVQFRKIHSQRKVKKTLLSWSKDYLWSLAFMCWTVGGMKSALCLLNNMGSPLDGRITPLLSLLASPSIFFLQKSRGYEVSMFTIVRACRSAYIYTKKRQHFKLSSQKQLCFIMLYGLLAYFYLQAPECIKNRSFLNSLWGEL